MGKRKYWIVWRVGGEKPTVMHQTSESATAEAKRLSKKNPGQTFSVLVAEKEVTFKPEPQPEIVSLW